MDRMKDRRKDGSITIIPSQLRWQGDKNVYAPYYETSMKILPISLTLKEKQNLAEGKIPNFTGLQFYPKNMQQKCCNIINMKSYIIHGNVFFTQSFVVHTVLYTL